MTRAIRSALALGAFFVLTVALAACGGIPGNAVVRVGDSDITKKTFDHWVRVAARSTQTPGGGGAVSVPDAPKFKRCIAQKRQSAAKPGKGQPNQTDAQFKGQCKQEYEQLRDVVLKFLIQAKWIEGEASDLGVSASNKDVNKEFDREKKQQFPNESDFQQFLKSSGMSLADLRFQVKQTLLKRKIVSKITKKKKKVTDKQVVDFYNSNKQRFGQAERRDLQVVLTKTKAKADEAKSAISGGEDFAKVAKRLSVDQASKSQGGKLAGLARGQQEKALDDAVFSARLNQLSGPIKTQFGFYVFKVTKSTPPSQQSLEQVKPQIRQELQSRGQDTALRDFEKKFQKKWRGKTECRSGFKVAELCGNSPKPKPQTAPGGVPQGGGAQGGGAQGGAAQGGGAQAPPQQAPSGQP